jgi:hypothetical protein
VKALEQVEALEEQEQEQEVAVGAEQAREQEQEQEFPQADCQEEHPCN